MKYIANVGNVHTPHDQEHEVRTPVIQVLQTPDSADHGDEDEMCLRFPIKKKIAR